MAIELELYQTIIYNENVNISNFLEVQAVSLTSTNLDNFPSSFDSNITSSVALDINYNSAKHYNRK